MPTFEILNTVSPTENQDGIVIDSEDAIQSFISAIQAIHAIQPKDTKEIKIYVTNHMLPKMKEAAEKFPENYKQAFLKLHPTGLVGFSIALESRSNQVTTFLRSEMAENSSGSTILFDKKRTMSQSQELEMSRSLKVEQPNINKESYENIFSKNPYSNLGKLITHQNEAVMDLPGHGRTYHFKRHLDNILPIVSFAVVGARKEWLDASVGDSKIALQEKMEIFEAVEGMLHSLRALANNKSRYTDEYFKNKLSKLSTLLDAQKIDSQEKEILMQTLQQVVAPHLVENNSSMFYQHKKGSTAFDATLGEMKIGGHQKRVKIEHKKIEGSGVIAVTGKFKYSRRSVIGVQTGPLASVKKIFTQRKNQLLEMEAQVSDFVTIALNEYQKGTAENPIYLQPSKGNQAELSLAILMEFKKRAIIEGRDLIASDDAGKRIKITSSYEFSELEKAYFKQFAMQVPKVRVNERETVASIQPAGYHLYKDVKIDNGKSLKEVVISSATFEQVSAAMTKHLRNSIEKHIAEQEKKMTQALAALPDTIKTSEANNRARI